MESELQLKELAIKLHRNYFIIIAINITISYRVSVFVNAGSRHEDLETSGTAHLLERSLLRGTSNRTKNELAQDIENLGARYGADTGREISKYAL